MKIVFKVIVVQVDFSKEVHVWALSEVGIPIGTVIVRSMGPVVSFKMLFVSTDFRRRGVGTSLVNEVILMASELGVNSVSCLVDNKNSIAQAFYKKIGFECVYYDGEDFIFNKKIA